jgi:hypothetical protein
VVHGKKFVASLSQIPPIMPFLPTQPTRKPCAVYNLPEESFRGMEEVIGPIPIRPTKKTPPLQTNNLQEATNLLLRAFGSKLPKPVSRLDSEMRPLSPLFRPPAEISLQLFFLSTSTTLERDALPSILALR